MMCAHVAKSLMHRPSCPAPKTPPPTAPLSTPQHAVQDLPPCNTGKPSFAEKLIRVGAWDFDDEHPLFHSLLKSSILAEQLPTDIHLATVASPHVLLKESGMGPLWAIYETDKFGFKAPNRFLDVL